MKKFRFTATLDIDFAKERARIKKCFSDEPDVMKRQMDLIDLFESEQLNEWIEAYNALPRSETSECPEQEFVGMIFGEVINILLYSKFKVEEYEIK